VTTGGENGTNGWARVQWGPWLLILAVGSVITFVNITSVLLEAQRDGDQLDWWKPFTWEVSSLAVNMALAPFIGEAVRRLPPRQDNLLRFLTAHMALTVPFSMLHIAGMVGLRKAIYALMGDFYDFSHGVLGRELFYEWRKDVLTYAAFAAVYWFFQWRAERPPPARQDDDRIEIRDGGTAVFLAPADILLVEAAGNYITFNTTARNYLVRATLAAWEARLAAKGFVRVHRSRLVNRARIGALKSTPSGDVEITLDDGRTVLGSRRYRAALETSEARQT
jgi:hypothetical protein